MRAARDSISLPLSIGFGFNITMVKALLVFACWCLLLLSLPLQAFEWGTATYDSREYVTLQSFCYFYGFYYQYPSGNNYFTSRSSLHSLRLKLGSPDLYLDGVHYVMSFPVENDGRDWLVSRMDVIKLFDPVLRPTAVADRHSIRGVVIDAGHGGTDNGATSRLGAEKNYTLDTAFLLESMLRNAGLRTVLTRRNDVFVDLYERAHIASLYPDYAFVSLHFNSATPEARGLETYCLSPRGAASTSSAYLTRADIQKLPGNDYDALNILLASMVHSEIIRLNPGDPTADRGVKRARFVVIKQNVLPAILVEGGFVSNRMEAARVNRPDYRQALAQAIARGILRFVNVMGDRHMSLPEEQPEMAPAPPPRAIAVTPPLAPAGLARDSSGVKKTTYPVAKPVNLAGSTGTTTSTSHKSRKHKKTSTPTVTPLTPRAGGQCATADESARERNRVRAVHQRIEPALESHRTGDADPHDRRGQGAAGAGRAADGDDLSHCAGEVLRRKFLRLGGGRFRESGFCPVNASFSERPIGAFDSGVGGLTVVHAMRALLPTEDILYLGDTARVPYGNKSPETILRYSRENVAYLRRHDVKAIVVACNTASAHALGVLQKEADVPVIGVIAPGVEAALAATRNRRIGIIGTQGTIQSAAYQDLLRELEPDVFILAQPAPLLVSLVEEDWLSHPATRLILEEYLAPMKAAQIDTLVLACTHYPLLHALAQEVLGPGVVLVDSARNTAAVLARKLQATQLTRTGRAERGSVTICTTDLPKQFSRLAERFLGEEIEEIQQVSVG